MLRLVTFIGEKYFQGQTDNLHEYDIATEVLGRSKETFNPGEDAIVRVEVHRLRKRLTEYYAGEGKDHPIHLSIPPGTYVPVFTRHSSGPEKLDRQPVQTPKGTRHWPGFVVIAVIAFMIFGGYLLFRAYRTKRNTVGSTASNVQQTSPANSTHYAEVPLRVLAGYTGKPHIDSAGNVWQPDQYFHFGGTWDRPNAIVSRASDPMLFEHWRNGDFSYDIPLQPGIYELHLFFVSTDAAAGGPLTFSISINGKSILSSFDVNIDALGPNTADERIFRDISPGSDGFLRIGFTGERASAMVNAIEILPGTSLRQLPIRLVTQPSSFTDHSGQFWRPDDYYLDGYTEPKRAKIAGTLDPDLFAAERYGHFTYAIPVDARDHYTVILHFAEFYFGPSASGVGGAGSRVFRVLCNGATLLDNFDIYKEAGSLHELAKTFYHLKPTAQGKIYLTFEPVVNNATVSGIEVLDESQ
jgi:hypothetical protein